MSPRLSSCTPERRPPSGIRARGCSRTAKNASEARSTKGHDRRDPHGRGTRSPCLRSLPLVGSPPTASRRSQAFRRELPPNDQETAHRCCRPSSRPSPTQAFARWPVGRRLPRSSPAGRRRPMRIGRQSRALMQTSLEASRPCRQEPLRDRPPIWASAADSRRCRARGISSISGKSRFLGRRREGPQTRPAAPERYRARGRTVSCVPLSADRSVPRVMPASPPDQEPWRHNRDRESSY